MKLIDASTTATVTVQQYIDAAETACSEFNSESPFLCMDMTLLATFLKDGFGFDRTMKLKTTNSINGKETSWSLGASFALFD